MYGYQAKMVQAATVSSVALALAGGCAGANRVPHVGPYLAGLCGFVGAPTLSSIWADITALIANTRVSNSACYQMRVPVGSGLRRTDLSKCA